MIQPNFDDIDKYLQNLLRYSTLSLPSIVTRPYTRKNMLLLAVKMNLKITNETFFVITRYCFELMVSDLGKILMVEEERGVELKAIYQPVTELFTIFRESIGW